MSKYAKKTPASTWILRLIVIAVLLIASVMILTNLPGKTDAQPSDTTADTTQASSDTIQTSSDTTATEPSVKIELFEQAPINLGYGLEITEVGNYTGLFMEDGSNEIVSNVMMLIVSNNGESDFQLAQITAACGEEEFHFSLTNLPAGEKVVLLELDRKSKPVTAPVTAIMENPVLFAQSMDLHADQLKISGMDGMLNVKNISDTDISGDIYIYYKYTAADIFYGGITFRTILEGGLKAGELRQIPAAHFDSDGSMLVQVEIVS